MNPIYIGVDIAGAANTWVCGISSSGDGLEICLLPRLCPLSQIVQYVEENPVLAVAIDAQLTSSIDDENGFRSSDMQLRSLLPSEYRTWVASQNSLMAVPLRGKQLAEAVSPLVGTVIETHPRACIYLANPNANYELVGNYKKPDYVNSIIKLMEWWMDEFNIKYHQHVRHTDGALDSVICATIAFLYHNNPDKLLKLDHNAANRTGRGPFFVIKPGPVNR